VIFRARTSSCSEPWGTTSLETDPIPSSHGKEPMVELDLQKVQPRGSSSQISQFKRRTHETASSSSICCALHNRAYRNATAHGVLAPTLKLESHIQLFSSALENALDLNEAQSLLNFLDSFDPHSTLAEDERSLASKFDKVYKDFSSRELTLSQQEAEKLVLPSGPFDAEVGVLLHVNHYNPGEEDKFKIGRNWFWDPYSRSIEVLSRKGFTQEHTFGMDWHHRAIPREAGCPLQTWSRELGAAHDEFSSAVLKLIPCPFLIVGGFCAWESYLKSCKHRHGLVSFDIPGDVKVVYALEYEDCTRKKVRRITAKIDHPSYAFHLPNQADHIVTRFDTQCNFVLYLGGRDFKPSSHQEAINDISLGRKRSAPFQELWQHRDKEVNMGRPLKREDIDVSFFIWLRSYLTPTKTENLLQSGNSVIQAALESIAGKQSGQAFEREETFAAAKGHALCEGIHKKANPRGGGRAYMETEIHHFKIQIPFHAQDADFIRRTRNLDIQIKVVFVDPTVERRNLAAPNACSHDSGYGLCIELKYEVQREGKAFVVSLHSVPTIRSKPHLRLCQINSLADLVALNSSRYSSSQPHRLIISNKKGVQNGYTYCQDSKCEVCFRFAEDDYKKIHQEGIGLWVKR